MDQGQTDGSVLVSFQAEDSQCIPTTWYRLNGGDTIGYQGSPLLIARVGTTTIEYWSTDASRNAEDTKVAVVYVSPSSDVVPPKTTMTVSTVKAGSTDVLVLVTFAAQDAGSDPVTWYRLNGGAPSQYDGFPVVIFEASTATIEYWSVDASGNEEAHKSTPVVARITLSAPPSASKGRAAVVRGTISPAHTAGSKPVLVRFERRVRNSTGKLVWKLWKELPATAAKGTSSSKFSATVAFPSSGRWRYRARLSPADTDHASMTTAWKSVSVAP